MATATTEEVRALHTARAASFKERGDALEAFGNRVSAALLIVFIAVVLFAGSALVQQNVAFGVAAGVLAAIFVAMQFWHAAIHARRDDQQARAALHLKHVSRMNGEWKAFKTSARILPPDHVYAYDIDLVGPGSLFQRIDVTHTRFGEETLARWLSEAADPEQILARQRIVAELAMNLPLREDLEAAALRASGSEKLDPTLFLNFVKEQKRVFQGRGWLVVIVHLLPIATLLLIALSSMQIVAPWLAAASFGASVALNLAFGAATNEALNLVAARKRYAESFGEMLRVLEAAKLESAETNALRDRMRVEGALPSDQMKRLERWAGLAELRTQPPVHIFVNQFLLWDLHCLFRLERWADDVGAHAHRWFDVLAEFESLSSLATLAHQDSSCTYPEIADSKDSFEATALAHPLLDPAGRVANDVRLSGPGSALLVTGSNMAGKSTLLRSVGLNLALAFAGGPVCATHMRCPRVRLRASMRAEDSLQSGASYFRAELKKLESVIENAEVDPPVFFLLDELLRGTNATARHAGSRAIILHLLKRHGTGLVATHDTALASLETELPGRVRNAHFTDVAINGEMTFDYALREGVVKTSNALRLLKMAGVDVDAEALNQEQAGPYKIATKPA